MEYKFNFDEITSCHICPFFRETRTRYECALTQNACSNTTYNKSREADCPLIIKSSCIISLEGMQNLFNDKSIENNKILLSHLDFNNNLEDYFERNDGRFWIKGQDIIEGKQILYKYYDTPGRGGGKYIYSNNRINILNEQFRDKLLESLESDEALIDYYYGDKKLVQQFQESDEGKEIQKIILSYDIVADISTDWMM